MVIWQTKLTIVPEAYKIMLLACRLLSSALRRTWLYTPDDALRKTWKRRRAYVSSG
jgi:hypothetical protein